MQVLLQSLTALAQPNHHRRRPMLDRQRLIDSVVRRLGRVELLVRHFAERRSDVGHQHLGVDVLFDGMRQLAGKAFDVQPVLEAMSSKDVISTSMRPLGNTTANSRSLSCCINWRALSLWATAV